VRIPVVPAGTVATVEFRLPDGSAMVHLLLAGIAQAMLAAGEAPDLAATAEPLPRDFPAVGALFATHRTAFEEGGVFPAALVDALLARLRG
jgi:glutamine synthetase